MKLYIDTSSSERIKIRIDEKEITKGATKEKSQLLLPLINEELEKIGKSVKEIDSIEVNTGPGSFTGLRVGIAIANTLGWVLQVPVNGAKKLIEPAY